jgi:hypothetical protein
MDYAPQREEDAISLLTNGSLQLLSRCKAPAISTVTPSPVLLLGLRKSFPHVRRLCRRGDDVQEIFLHIILLYRSRNFRR